MWRWAAIALVVVTGCPAAQVRPPPSPPPSLVGAWQSACFKVINADETEGSARVTFGVTDSLWAKDTQLFGDDTCSYAIGTLHEDGGYVLEQPSAVAAGAWDVRLDVRTRTVTPHVEGFVAYLQSMSCGDTFKVDRASDLLDATCPALGARPFSTCPALHDVVTVGGPLLTLGSMPADGDLCSAAKRPRALGRAMSRMP